MELHSHELLSGLLRDHFDPLLKKYHEDLVQRLLSLESIVSDVADKVIISKDQDNSHMLISAWANDSGQNGFQQHMSEATSKSLPEEPMKEDYDSNDSFAKDDTTDTPLPGSGTSLLRALSQEVEEAWDSQALEVHHHSSTSTFLNSIALQQEATRGISIVPTGPCLTPLQLFVTCKSFDMTIICLILSNALFIGSQAQFFATTSQEDMPIAVRLLASGYGLLFLMELLLRIFAFGCPFFYNEAKAWNIADFTIVSLSIVEVVLLNFGDQQSGGLGGQLSMVRLVRIVRILRIIRFDFFRELRVLVVAIAGSLKSLMWALSLLAFIMYVVAIMLTFGAAEEAKSDEALDKYWSSLLRSMYTLWMSVTGGISWIEVSEPLGQVSIVYRLAFNCFIGFVQIAVLNVVTGVFCENAIQSAAQDEQEVMKGHIKRKAEYIQKLNGIFGHCEGEISIRDFETQMDSEAMKLYFETLDVHVGNVRTLFRLLDKDGSGLISTDELVTGCIELRGSAKAVDIAEAIHKLGYLQTANEEITSVVAGIDQKLAQLGAVVLSLKAGVSGVGLEVRRCSMAVHEHDSLIFGGDAMPTTPRSPPETPRSNAGTPMTTPHSPRLDIGLRPPVRGVVAADEPVEAVW